MSRVKKVLLTEWAKARYDPPPPLHTLRRWARTGEIVPQPEKAGGFYYCLANAERKGVPRGDHVGLAERIGT